MEGGHFQRIIGLAWGKGTVSHTTTWATGGVPTPPVAQEKRYKTQGTRAR